jgi:hypothetical protein
LNSCRSLQELPRSIGQLSALQTLIWMVVRAYKNYLHLLANWVHSKILIWIVVGACKNYLHLLANWVHSKI